MSRRPTSRKNATYTSRRIRTIPSRLDLTQPADVALRAKRETALVFFLGVLTAGSLRRLFAKVAEDAVEIGRFGGGRLRFRGRRRRRRRARLDVVEHNAEIDLDVLGGRVSFRRRRWRSVLHVAEDGVEIDGVGAQLELLLLVARALGWRRRARLLLLFELEDFEHVRFVGIRLCCGVCFGLRLFRRPEQAAEQFGAR